MSQTNNTQYKRAPAIITSVGRLVKATLKEEQDAPTSIIFSDQTVAVRINIVGVVTGEEKIGSVTNFTLDDGSGKIVVRSFEENKALAQVTIGDALLVIGKLRSYNDEKYVSPEVCKKIDPLWLKVRAKLLPQEQQEEQVITPEVMQVETQEPEEVKQEASQATESDEELVEDVTSTLPEEKIMNLIREIDQGDGALLEEVKEQANINNVDFLLERMLERGDIFQISPGKIKVL